MNSKSLIFILALFFVNLFVFSQESNSNIKVDCKRDTILIINNQKLCEKSNYLNREDFLNADSIQVNHSNLEVASYKVSSFTLGNNLNIQMHTSIITEELKSIISSGEISYKYINIEEVVLKNKQNNYYNPTLKNLKIIFLD